jgi:hypothetical protein
LQIKETKTEDLRKPLKIIFDGEEGIDQGGVAKVCIVYFIILETVCCGVIIEI